MSKYAERLWQDLVREHAPDLALAVRPGPSRARVLGRPRVLAGGTLGLAGVAAALTLALTGGTPAFAVTTNADGTVLVTLNQQTAVPQANAKLAAMGTPGAALDPDGVGAGGRQRRRHLPLRARACQGRRGRRFWSAPTAPRSSRRRTPGRAPGTSAPVSSPTRATAVRLPATRAARRTVDWFAAQALVDPATACQGAAMDVELGNPEWIGTARSFVGGIGVGTIDDAARLLAPDVVYRVLGHHALSGVFSGRDAVAAHLRAVISQTDGRFDPVKFDDWMLGLRHVSVLVDVQAGGRRCFPATPTPALDAVRCGRPHRGSHGLSFSDPDVAERLYGHLLRDP